MMITDQVDGVHKIKMCSYGNIFQSLRKIWGYLLTQLKSSSLPLSHLKRPNTKIFWYTFFRISDNRSVIISRYSTNFVLLLVLVFKLLGLAHKEVAPDIGKYVPHEIGYILNVFVD